MNSLTENVAKLTEANKLQAEIIDALFIELLQYRSVEEAERDYTPMMKRAAELMKDFE